MDHFFSTISSDGVVGLIALRILMGIGEGVMYTALTVLLAAWVPINERTTICCFAFGGSMVRKTVARWAAIYQIIQLL